MGDIHTWESNRWLSNTMGWVCVLESSNGVAGAEQTLPPDIIQTSHHTFGPQLDGGTVMMKNSVWRRRVIDHCYHVDRDLGSVTLIVRVSHIDSAISSPSHYLLQRNAWKYQITEVLFCNTSRAYFHPDIDSAVLRLTICKREYCPVGLTVLGQFEACSHICYQQLMIEGNWCERGISNIRSFCFEAI